MKNNIQFIISFLLVTIILTAINLPSSDIMIGIFRSKDSSLLIPSIFGTFINIIIFILTSFYLVPKILIKKGIYNFIIKLIVSVTILSFLEIGFDYYYALNLKLSLKEFFKDQVVFIILLHILTVVFAISYSFIRDWLINVRLKDKLEKEKLNMELNLLKSQINPHFLFNALNSLFSMALVNNDDNTANGISKLSEMMRYTLERSREKEVSIKNEIKYIEDYIYLQKLRFTNKIDVIFDYSSVQNSSKLIPPMMFIPFVENAFKYGVSGNQTNKIFFSLMSDNKGLTFVSENSFSNFKIPISSNKIGLENIKKQLKLLFPKKHQLEILQEKNHFKVKLNIEWM